ncbi:hypothetical protein ABI59_08075 [Acidobacteria bacterium Mor1]|nr:hypothetical protein ABI59_08075 [Acidobacteria bacterium Mor1]
MAGSAARKSADVLVIGAGVIGLSTAYFLARSGAAVTLLERGQPGRETSKGNCGLITPSHADPLTQPSSLKAAAGALFDAGAPLRIAPTLSPSRIGWLLGFARRCTEGHRAKAARARSALLRQTRRLIEEMVREEQLDGAFSPGGLTTVFRTQAALEHDVEAHEQMRELGVRHQVWSGEEVREREPLLREGLAGAIYAIDDAHIDPGRYVASLAEAVRRQGVSVETDVEVKRITAGASNAGSSGSNGSSVSAAGAVQVETTKGEYTAEHLVLAAGPWATALARPLGARLPVEPAKGYSITWPVAVEPMHTPLYFFEPKVVATPWPHGFRLGSTMEFCGFDASLNRGRLDKLLEGARGFLDHPLDLGPGEDWFGWRPMSVDEVPLIGPLQRAPRVWLGCGHGVLGMSQSAATGELLAGMIGGNTPAIDPAPYSPSRFGL